MCVLVIVRTHKLLAIILLHHFVAFILQSFCCIHDVTYIFDLAPGMMKGVKEANKLKKQLEKLKELQEIQRLKIEIEQKKREGIPIDPAQLTDGTVPVPGQPGQPPTSITMGNTNNNDVRKSQSRSRSRSYSRSRSRSYSSESRLLRSPSRSPLQSGFQNNKGQS